MRQRVMKETYRVSGEVGGGDITVCPICKKKFVVIPEQAGHTFYADDDIVTCPHCDQMFLAKVLMRRSRILSEGGDPDGGLSQKGT